MLEELDTSDEDEDEDSDDDEDEEDDDHESAQNRENEARRLRLAAFWGAPDDVYDDWFDGEGSEVDEDDVDQADDW